MVIHSGVACFFWVSHPRPKGGGGGGRQRPQIFWDPCVRPNGLTESDKIIWYDNIRKGVACFQGASHAPVSRVRLQRRPGYLGPPTDARTQYESQQPNFARWSNYRCQANLYTVDHECWRAICLRLLALLLTLITGKRRNSRRRFASPESAYSFCSLHYGSLCSLFGRVVCDLHGRPDVFAATLFADGWGNSSKSTIIFKIYSNDFRFLKLINENDVNVTTSMQTKISRIPACLLKLSRERDGSGL